MGDADVNRAQARLRHQSAKTTLDVYGHLWSDTADSTRAAIREVIAARADSRRLMGAMGHRWSFADCHSPLQRRAHVLQPRQSGAGPELTCRS